MNNYSNDEPMITFGRTSASHCSLYEHGVMYRQRHLEIYYHFWKVQSRIYERYRMNWRLVRSHRFIGYSRSLF